MGTFYFVRVSAMNSQGFGNIVRTSPTSLNPSQPPTAPTDVQLGSTSPSMLTVTFGPPVSDGGDTVTKYQVAWDKDPAFNSMELAPHKGVVQEATPLKLKPQLQVPGKPVSLTAAPGAGAGLI